MLHISAENTLKRIRSIKTEFPDSAYARLLTKHPLSSADLLTILISAQSGVDIQPVEKKRDAGLILTDVMKRLHAEGYDVSGFVRHAPKEYTAFVEKLLQRNLTDASMTEEELFTLMAEKMEYLLKNPSKQEKKKTAN